MMISVANLSSSTITCTVHVHRFFSGLHPSDHWTGCGGRGTAHGHTDGHMLYSGSHFEN